ncbi:MAG: hypothetical protein KTR28_07850 [Micavibrio sp.]|nr:hypothetical protein [Micavibrio sp.]
MEKETVKKGLLATAFTVAVVPFAMEYAAELVWAYTDWGTSVLDAGAEFLGFEGGIHGTPVDFSLIKNDAQNHIGEILSSKNPDGFAECFNNGGQIHEHGNAMACTPL